MHILVYGIKQNAENKNRNCLGRSRGIDPCRSRTGFSPNSCKPNLPYLKSQQRVLGFDRQLLWLRHKPSIWEPVCCASSANCWFCSSAIPGWLWQWIRLWLWLRSLLGKVNNPLFFYCFKRQIFRRKIRFF